MRTKSLTRVDKIRTQNSARAGSELRTTSLHGPGRTNWNCGLRAEGAANSNQNLWHERGPNKIGTQPFARTGEVSEPRTYFLASAWSFTVQPLTLCRSAFQALLFGSRKYSPRRFIYRVTIDALLFSHWPPWWWSCHVHHFFFLNADSSNYEYLIKLDTIYLKLFGGFIVLMSLSTKFVYSERFYTAPSQIDSWKSWRFLCLLIQQRMEDTI